MIMENDRTLA
jgi:hypothetical protein